MLKSKRGWMEIVEAFVAVMLIAATIIILFNNSNKKEDFSYEVYTIQISILREIQTNDTMREEIGQALGPLPIPWEDSRFPLNIKNKIIERTPNYLECIAQICDDTSPCNLNREVKKVFIRNLLQ
jgi:hypothetical protein